MPGLARKLDVMGQLIRHRGPDDAASWLSEDSCVGFTHRRLSIIDLTPEARQPMTAANGTVIAYNGEIYNYLELRDQLEPHWSFHTRSDTETILAAYERHGVGCLDQLRGMFAFALWNARDRTLFCARDRFGIKPFYYAMIGGSLVFASEIKAMMPLLDHIETDDEALAEYFAFQYPLNEHTLFQGVRQLPPGHYMLVRDGRIEVRRYWDVCYEPDFEHRDIYFQRRLEELVDESVRMHLRSDVPVGSYLSGGIDSSLISILAASHTPENNQAFHGKFLEYPGYDESAFARAAAGSASMRLQEVEIGYGDFIDNVEKVIYHLDHPIAGPGSFPQYMVSGLAARQVKVVLGGQGGDEIFGGYARYILAYFEQCIKAAIDGTYRNGNFVVTIESIVPNLGVLQEYKPLMRSFWSEGLFEPHDLRYFRLIDRSADMNLEVRWEMFDRGRVLESFRQIFNSESNVRKEAYFDSMTHFDFKCLLPALLHVEDRMSMAHGLEARVPFLDHPLVEFAATVPADVKFKDGRMKHLLKQTFADVIPEKVLNRRDKMGFPVPLNEWMGGPLREYINDMFRSEPARTRPYLNSAAVLDGLEGNARFSRKLWGLLNLELWQRQFHDRASEYRRMLDEPVDKRKDPANQLIASEI